eukprot:jgi/Tetstr1/436036/TSEL_024915.t1
MIDFACVSSATPTWSNDPRWCTPGITATEAEQGKLAADRASSAPVQGVHRYYPFVVEDRGRLGKSALTVVYIFAVLLVIAEVQQAYKAAKAAGKHVHMFQGSDAMTSKFIPLAFTVGGAYFAVTGLFKAYTGYGKGDL